MSLLNKLSKSGSIKPQLLSKSILFKEKDVVATDVPMLNVAFSGKLDGGFSSGLTAFAGPSKHFKTLFGLIAMKAYLKKYPEAIALFYDSEFGTPEGYFESLDIDVERVLHVPIKDVEELTHDIVQKLNDIERGEKVFIFVDSVGNLASKKEAQDALDGKSVADMTRAKAMKSLFRIVTPHLTMKDLPMFVINHSYETMCLDGNTKVRTATGMKKIKNIKTGEYVYSINGLQKVLNTFGPEDLNPENKRYLKLTFEDGSSVKCTHDHKFLMEDGTWKKAEDIKIGENFK